MRGPGPISDGQLEEAERHAVAEAVQGRQGSLIVFKACFHAMVLAEDPHLAIDPAVIVHAQHYPRLALGALIDIGGAGGTTAVRNRLADHGRGIDLTNATVRRALRRLEAVGFVSSGLHEDVNQIPWTVTEAGRSAWREATTP